MSTEAIKRELRAAMAQGDSNREAELRTRLDSAGETLPTDRRHAIIGHDRVERAIDAPGVYERGN